MYREEWLEKCIVDGLGDGREAQNPGMGVVSRNGKGKEINSHLQSPEQNTVLPTP